MKENSKSRYVISLAILAFMFFVFGFVSWLNAILIPFFKVACELTITQSFYVTFAFYFAYLVMSIPGGILLKKVGFKRGIMYGFFALSLGALLFVPAALGRTFEIFLIGLYTMGTGLAILQSAANPYVTIIGPLDKTVQRMSMMGVCNKFAGIVSPLIFAAFTLRMKDTEIFAALPMMDEAAKNLVLDELIRRVILPYSLLSGLMLIIGLFIRYSVLPEIDTEHESVEVAASHGGKTNVLQFPYLVLGALAIFLHVGTQAIAIDSAIGYGTAMGLSIVEAKGFASYTLTATIIGYVIGIFCVPRFINQTNTLRICTLTGLILSLCILFVPGEMILGGKLVKTSICFLFLLGLPNALIYAGIWPLAIRNLGRFTKIGSSIMVMGLFGNGALTLAYGKLADHLGASLTGIREAYWILIPCFLYLVYYAFHGHKITSWTKNKNL